MRSDGATVEKRTFTDFSPRLCRFDEFVDVTEASK